MRGVTLKLTESHEPVSLDAVVNDHFSSEVSGVPAKLAIRGPSGPPLRVIVYVCPNSNGSSGTSSILPTLRTYRTLELIGIGVVVSSVSATVDEFTVVGSSACENVAAGVTSSEILVSPRAGVIERTRGGVTVVKVHVRSAASGLPAKSFTPASPPFTTAVYLIPPLSGAVGSNVKIREFASGFTVVCVKSPDKSRSSTVELFTVLRSIASLKVTITFANWLTFFAPSTGENDVTVGGVLSTTKTLISDGGSCRLSLLSIARLLIVTSPEPFEGEVTVQR